MGIQDKLKRAGTRELFPELTPSFKRCARRRAAARAAKRGQRRQQMDSRYLCRAKRTDNGEWVEGFVVCMPNTPTVKILVHCKSYVSKWRQEFDIYDVNPLTLCQCTGLTDKNGKLIWENDIVKRTDMRFAQEIGVGLIQYDVDNTAFLIYWEYEKLYSPTYPWKEIIEVAGNVFDNSELLEVE